MTGGVTDEAKRDEDGKGATRSDRSKHSAATRRRLLDAARRTFLRFGYQKATLDQIADEAGFTKGALYWHFPNKQAIFLALVADAVEVAGETLQTYLAIGERDGGAAMERALGEWIDRIDEQEDLPLLGVEIEIESRHNESFRALHHKLVLQHEASLASFFERFYAIVGRAPPMLLPTLAQSILIIFKGSALTRLNYPGRHAGSAPLVRRLLGLPPAS